MPGGDRSLRIIAPLVPRVAGVGAYGAIDASGLCEALRQAAEERQPPTRRRFARRSRDPICGSCRPRRSSNRAV
jgi:hypothetical protein